MSTRGKKGIFRSYDKGVEMGIGSEMVTRLELEIKREKAHTTALRLVKTNDIAGNFRAYFNVKSQDFERVMESPAVTFHRGKNLIKQDESEALDNKWTWLLKQVAPALKQAIEDDKEAGLGNDRMIQFIIASGMHRRINRIANDFAYEHFRDMLRLNELVPRKKD